jgi:polyribonucleotide nucleotidyltransferase
VKPLSPYAPRIEIIKINPEKIGELIGPGGKNIKAIQAESGAEISIEDDGTVYIYATRKEGMERAVELVGGVSAEPEIGKIYTGKVVSTTNFGAFMRLFGNKDGLIHISELADFRVKQTEDVVKVGEMVTAKCIGIDEKGRVKMSRKAAMKELDEKAKAGA